MLISLTVIASIKQTDKNIKLIQYLLWTLFIVLCRSVVHYYINCGRCCIAPVYCNAFFVVYCLFVLSTLQYY